VPALLGWTAPTTAVQVPTEPATSQAWHWLPHAVLQQTPSTQLPEAHCEPDVQAVPLIAAHLPSEPVTLHAIPGLAQAVSQQTVPTQLPVEHWSLALQTAPFACLATQCAPAPQ
jgi:hypothetical protein